MIFNYTLGMKEIEDNNITIYSRHAVRGIILKDDTLLMVHCNRGDYKFPGGGIHKRELPTDALIREVREETGYIVNKIEDMVGTVTERKIDEYNKDSIFEMISSYYICNVSNETTLQELDYYESKLDFSPKWIKVDDAIKINEEILFNASTKQNNWLLRELTVLKAIKEITYAY